MASTSMVTLSDDDHCPFCRTPVSGRLRWWALLSRHRTSEGEVEYCSGGCGCQVLVVDGEIVKTLVRRPRPARVAAP
ncbi:hypothetical protein [Streptomyces sp. NPDC093984]|uniref:hypothetical protein n=1 Tax=Streptomyces sp. NPDC093984 TaxID=3366052 RepID=UPI0037FB04C1